MNILIVTQYFWPEDFRINDLAVGLKRAGSRVTVLTGKPNYPAGRFFDGYGFFGRRRESYRGIEIVRSHVIPRGRAGRFRLAVNYLSFAFMASWTGLRFCREQYDIIFVYAPSPITAALPGLALRRLRGIPIMLWVQDLWPESVVATGAVKSASLLRQLERLVKFIYRRSDRILIQSEAFRLPIRKLGVNDDRIDYLPNSAEEVYRPVSVSSVVAERDQVPSGFTVMYAGNIGVAQGFETILAAAEILKSYSDIHWVVLGDGRAATWVRSQIAGRGLGSSIYMLGRHPMEDMPKYFALADVMLVTLKDERIFRYTIPGRVQSYLACGRPIIACMNGEGSRIVEEAGAGLTAAAEDAHALADAVFRMYKMSRSERDAMGARGREYFLTHFEGNMLLNRLEKWMNELVEEKKRADSHNRR